MRFGDPIPEGSKIHVGTAARARILSAFSFDEPQGYTNLFLAGFPIFVTKALEPNQIAIESNGEIILVVNLETQ